MAYMFDQLCTPETEACSHLLLRRLLKLREEAKAEEESELDDEVDDEEEEVLRRRGGLLRSGVEVDPHTACSNSRPSSSSSSMSSELLADLNSRRFFWK